MLCLIGVYLHVQNQYNDSEYLFCLGFDQIKKKSQIDIYQATVHFQNALYCKTVVAVHILLLCILDINAGYNVCNFLCCFSLNYALHMENLKALPMPGGHAPQ